MKSTSATSEVVWSWIQIKRAEWCKSEVYSCSSHEVVDSFSWFPFIFHPSRKNEISSVHLCDPDPKSISSSLHLILILPEKQREWLCRSDAGAERSNHGSGVVTVVLNGSNAAFNNLMEGLFNRTLAAKKCWRVRNASIVCAWGQPWQQSWKSARDGVSHHPFGWNARQLCSAAGPRLYWRRCLNVWSILPFTFFVVIVLSWAVRGFEQSCEACVWVPTRCLFPCIFSLQMDPDEEAASLRALTKQLQSPLQTHARSVVTKWEPSNPDLADPLRFN